MMRSMYSAVSGLKNHQTRMDIIGNNIANVNTTGYKSSRVVFQDIYSQTSRTASAGSDTGISGGTNPIQIGLGMGVAAIDVLHTRSATQRTDNPLDLAIEGDGFFIVDTNGTEDGGQYYTRAGNFYVDNENSLVNANGYYVQGVLGDTKPTGEITAMTNILIPDNYYDVTVDADGAVYGLDRTTKEKSVIGYIAIATFDNVSGLEKAGNSMYAETANSGEAAVYAAGVGAAGQLNPGGLEMSNVDLAAEFTDMIITQRGFQANSRVITTSDSILEELVNLKR